MPFRLLTPCLLCTTTLFVSACTETIVREIPVSSDGNNPLAEQAHSGSTATESEASDVLIAPTTVASSPQSPTRSPILEPGTTTPETVAASASPGDLTQTPATLTGNASDSGIDAGTVDLPVQAAAGNESLPSGSFADPVAPAVAGEPGVLVDCQLMLPCRWSSDDGSLSVTATSADNIATRERLSVSFTVSTNHDTSLGLGSSPAATSEGAGNYNVTEQILGAGNGNSPQALLAGASIRGQLDYHASAGAALSTWTLALFDNGLARNAMFGNLPVGAAINADADCDGALPCTWSTTSGDVTVTLLSAGGLAGSGRLSASFSIVSTRDRTFAIDNLSTATGNDGIVFSSRTHELAQQSGYQRLTQPSVAGTSVPGSVDFFRTESQPIGLASLMLSLFDDEPSPRWNPLFLNVPVL